MRPPSPRALKAAAVIALTYLFCWGTPLAWSPTAVRRLLLNQVPGESQVVEPFEPGINSASVVPDALRGKAWIFFDHVRCWAPFLISADLACLPT